MLFSFWAAAPNGYTTKKTTALLIESAELHLAMSRLLCMATLQSAKRLSADEPTSNCYEFDVDEWKRA